MKLFLALPVYGGYNPHFITCLLELLRRPPCPILVRPRIGDSLIPRARNNSAKEFLETDCTHLLFLDTDLLFTPEHIKRLISHPQCSIVCGLYPKKERDLAWVCNPCPEEKLPLENGLWEVKYAGTGCMLIARGVFESMIEWFPENAYEPDTGEEGLAWDFFPVGPMADARSGHIRYHSEDWGFCNLAAKMGVPTWMDTHVILKHVGEIAYPLQDLETFAEPVAS